MIYETDRLTCVLSNDVAHVQFKNSEVVEYSQADKIGPELRHIGDEFEFHILLIDCAALSFVTSTVLEAFVSVYLRCRRKDREVRLVNANGLVRDMLRTTRLDRIMPIFDRLDDALKISKHSPGR